ncbi:hypothetical protein VA7868_00238 [Vibrio aerogenes CECT 7868]|uniref:HAMP domain protein n=1 Tax=Vibrio aerogenes CECT 7868 TaxID=1216006 RepID=A0A1M5V281_9VIBR|nr:hypothetical protein VA7868_00238 [Vibrio aerogenes CECT 7868]
MKVRGYSLSLHIGSLFLIITSLVGIVLIYISYQHAQELLDETAKQLSYENSRKIETRYQQNIGPVLTTLDFLAYTTITDEPDFLIKDKRLLASTFSVFERNPHLVALYFADQAGNFSIIRPLIEEKDKKRFHAPDNAILYMNKTRTDGKNEFYYLDENFRQTDYREDNSNQFDPRQRPWYILAGDDGKIRLTEPYFFYFLKTHGITLSRKTPDGRHVIGADFTLASLSEQIKHIGFSNQTQLILFDQQYNVLGQHNSPVSTQAPAPRNQAKLQQSVFAPVMNRMSTQVIYETVSDNQATWSVTLTPVVLTPHVTLLLAEATPKNDLLAPLLSLRDKQLTVTIILLASGFILAFLIARHLTKPLTALVSLTGNITQFKFRKSIYPRSAIKEISDLSRSLQLMENTLSDILKLLKETAGNHDAETLAKTITHQSYLVTRAETVIFYALTAESQTFSKLASHTIIPFKIDINVLLKDIPWIKSQLQRGETVHIRRADNIVKKYAENLYNSDIYLFPLMDHHHQLTGILNLGYERELTREQTDKHAFLGELLSFAQVAKENIDHIQQQKSMFHSLVESVATAIDTKSPYSNGNCQRIPSLVKWLTEAVDQDERYYPYFKMDELQWEALHLAAWLHDCMTAEKSPHRNI